MREWFVCLVCLRFVSRSADDNYEPFVDDATLYRLQPLDVLFVVIVLLSMTSRVCANRANKLRVWYCHHIDHRL